MSRVLRVHLDWLDPRTNGTGVTEGCCQPCGTADFMTASSIRFHRTRLKNEKTHKAVRETHKAIRCWTNDIPNICILAHLIGLGGMICMQHANATLALHAPVPL
jgi:hypothetical protein